jgi:hypothetical protein
MSLLAKLQLSFESFNAFFGSLQRGWPQIKQSFVIKGPKEREHVGKASVLKNTFQSVGLVAKPDRLGAEADELIH